MKKLFFLLLLMLVLATSNSYAENICSPNPSSSNTDAGTIYDSGGPSGGYSNNENCAFLIQPTSSPSSITLNFSQFKVENTYDYLYIYDGTSTSGTLLGRFTGYSLPSSVTATSGSMYLRFISDYSVRYRGFTASWSSSSSSISCTNVKDSFSSLSYSNNNGTQNWTNSWQEVGESDGVSAGKARVRNDLCSSGYCLRLGTPSNVSPSSYSNRGVTRQADLSNSTSATLTFNYFKGVRSGTSTVILSVSNNGGSSWTALKTFSITSTNLSATPESFDLTSYISANTQIRFLGSGSNTSVTGMYIDDIKIDYCKSTSTSSVLIASYNFDDDWVTNNSLTDQTGSFNGTPSGSISRVLAGSSGSKGDTCYAGSFTGGDIDITSLPVSTSSGAKTSVSFWMYWDGTNNVMPMGWYRHDLWLVKGAFGYNTWSNDVYGISSTGLSTGWHHVAAVFTNGSVNNNNLYIDGVQQSMSQRFGSANSSNAVVQSALRIGGVTITSIYNFRGLLDNFKIYSGEITQTQVTSDMNESNTCSGGGGDTPATAFNCVENGANGITGKLYTKTTAQSFSIDVVALQDASTIETNFASGADHTVTVEFVNTSSGASCSTYTALSPAVSQNLTLTSSDNGTKASVALASSTAYSSIKCRITDSTDSPSVVGCSTDSFAIRPTTFSISSSLTNTGSTGLPKAKAGDNYTLTATASTGYNGTPTISNADIQAHSGAIQTGSISGSFAAANSLTGISSGSAFSYSEVGSLRFLAYGIYDDSFTSVDQSSDCTNDFSNTVDGNGKVGCKFGNTASSNYFGRFTPDHFDVSLNTPAFAPSCGTFTYLGQPFKYTTTPVASVTAKNASGTTTQNYTGDFWKISAASLTPSYSEATYALNVLDSNAPLVVDSGNGTGTLTYTNTSSNILALTKSALSSPYNAEIALNFTLSDTDAIVVANVDGSAQINPVKFGAASSGNGISFTGSNNVQRWGRAVITNAHGSELLPLSIPLLTEYYNGTGLVINTADNCTNFTLATDFSISDTADNNCTFSSQNSPVAVGSGSVKASIGNTTVSNGTTELIISDNSTINNGPGAGNTGYIDLTSKLSNLSWLLYDWDGNGTHDNCPNARATFGIYKGNSKQIYFREVY